MSTEGPHPPTPEPPSPNGRWCDRELSPRTGKILAVAITLITLGAVVLIDAHQALGGTQCSTHF